MNGACKPVAIMSAGGEVLALDWNKYRPMTLATGGTDRTVRVWDAHAAQSPARLVPEKTVLMGHQYAVRDVAWSPHHASMLASASYDMTVRVWSTENTAVAAQVPMVNSARQIYTGHKEFVVGVSWALFEAGLIASTSWDMETQVWPAMV